MPVEPLPTALVSDAAGRRIAMNARMRAVWRGARLAGPALTVRTPPGEHLAVREALEAARPGDVMVVDGGGALECALWGGKMSRRAQERGIAGLVVDGAVRDVDEIEELRFPVFALATSPMRPGGDSPGEIGGRVVCGDAEVFPGDIVYGDADGVVVVPRALHADVVERASRIDQ